MTYRLLQSCLSPDITTFHRLSWWGVCQLIERPDGSLCAPHEVGEIVGRGPSTTPGYDKRPDLTAQALRHGWLYSGDLGSVDADGFLSLVDRQKDPIISGGVNVYPRDIEEIVVQHAAVREVAVFGVPDARWGTRRWLP